MGPSRLLRQAFRDSVEGIGSHPISALLHLRSRIPSGKEVLGEKKAAIAVSSVVKERPMNPRAVEVDVSGVRGPIMDHYLAFGIVGGGVLASAALARFSSYSLKNVIAFLLLFR